MLAEDQVEYVAQSSDQRRTVESPRLGILDRGEYERGEGGDRCGQCSYGDWWRLIDPMFLRI